MYEMLADYEQSRLLLHGRMQELETALREETLTTEEQDDLQMRIRLLRTELGEHLHTIISLRELLGLSGEGLDGRSSIGRSTFIRPGICPESDPSGGEQPPADAACPKGAA